jgi:hypothetical protein
VRRHAGNCEQNPGKYCRIDAGFYGGIVRVYGSARLYMYRIIIENGYNSEEGGCMVTAHRLAPPSSP